MKYLISILLLFVTLNSFSQTELNFKPEKQQNNERLIRLGMFTSSIILNAVGESQNNHGNKDIGHLCTAASYGIVLSIPLIINVDKSKWYWYILEYASLRFALFDYAYNISAGLPLNYHGNSNYYDRVMNNNESWYIAKGLTFTLGIAIDINEL